MLRRVTSFTLLATLVLTALLVDPPRKAKAIGGAISRTIVISQVYGGAGCGTPGCSTYGNDYIELYNRSTTPISLNGMSVQYGSATGNVGTAATTVTALPNVTLQPGQYFLVAETGNANGVNTIPTPDAGPGTISMSATAGKVALVNCITPLNTLCPSNVTGTCSVLDFVGYGATANCSETSPAPAPSTTTAIFRAGNGNIDTDNNSTDFTAAAPTPRNTSTAFNTPTAADGHVTGQITTGEGQAIAGTVISLSGTQNRKTITDANGHYQFDNVETNGFYTVSPSRTNFTFSPLEHSFSMIGNRTEAVFTGSIVGSDNPLDTPEYFVRQHYLDFLGREPDEAGFNFWSDQLLECSGDAVCIERRTINVSAAYFKSIEFQDTGGLVDRLYRASYGRNALYAEFIPDQTTIARNLVVGRSGWEAVLQANKQAFIASWVGRADFRAAFDGLGNDAYVNTLVTNTGASFSQAERDAFVSGLNTNALSRADVLGQIVTNENFVRARFNEAFVLMEYLGYLRRDPDPSGFQFWVNKLNQFDGNFERAEMVKAFITSGEYRARFNH